MGEKSAFLFVLAIDHSSAGEAAKYLIKGPSKFILQTLCS